MSTGTFCEAGFPYPKGNLLPCDDRSPPPRQTASETTPRYPISQFLTTYKVPLHPVAADYVSPWAGFKMTVEKSTLDVVNMRRSINLVLEHPGVIWPVIAFEADVVSWGELGRRLSGAGRFSHFSLSLSLT